MGNKQKDLLGTTLPERCLAKDWADMPDDTLRIKLRGIFPDADLNVPGFVAKLRSICLQLNANPFVDRIYTIRLGGKPEIIPHYSLSIAKLWASGELRGIQFNFFNDPSESRDLASLAVRTTLQRGDVPLTVETYFREVNRRTPMWAAMPHFLLMKTSLLQAARFFFPDVLGPVVYDKDEIDGEV